MVQMISENLNWACTKGLLFGLEKMAQIQKFNNQPIFVTNSLFSAVWDEQMDPAIWIEPMALYNFEQHVACKLLVSLCKFKTFAPGGNWTCSSSMIITCSQINQFELIAR